MTPNQQTNDKILQGLVISLRKLGKDPRKLSIRIGHGHTKAMQWPTDNSFPMPESIKHMIWVYHRHLKKELGLVHPWFWGFLKEPRDPEGSTMRRWKKATLIALADAFWPKLRKTLKGREERRSSIDK